jgi:UDP-N-acetyl-2-amino-2-deoxyglucuronate dehydrogenase
MPRNFAVTGVAGFVAPRHLEAIRACGHRLIAAIDPHDAVGLLDRYSFDVRFFTEFERFDRHLEKLRRGPDAERVHYISVCSPNYLHDAHVRLALRVGADAICEKPLVISPWNLDALADLERETGRRVYTVLQLRTHPKLLELRERLLAQAAASHEVELTYITTRGRWYGTSWKGSTAQSGGLAMNIGVHFFDLLGWLFGRVSRQEVHLREPSKAAGFMQFDRAAVRWYLSTDAADLPFPAEPGGRTTFRSIVIDGDEVEFTDGFTGLHTEVYRGILDGHGYGIEDARPSIELSWNIGQAPVCAPSGPYHPRLRSSQAADSASKP